MLPLDVARSGPAPYSPTYSFDGEAINERHRALLHAPVIDGTVKIAHEIYGALRRADAAKLYELAFFSSGDILELGTANGLSASIMADARSDSDGGGTIHTVELGRETARRAAGNLEAHRNVVIHNAEAAEWLASAIRRGHTFGLAFIDHSHRYDDVRVASAMLDQVIDPGSFVAFHDFIDARNFDPSRTEYGVAQGAAEGLSDQFEFVGGCGCMGLYRYDGTGKRPRTRMISWLMSRRPS